MQEETKNQTTDNKPNTITIKWTFAIAVILAMCLFIVCSFLAGLFIQTPYIMTNKYYCDTFMDKNNCLCTAINGNLVTYPPENNAPKYSNYNYEVWLNESS